MLLGLNVSFTITFLSLKKHFKKSSTVLTASLILFSILKKQVCIYLMRFVCLYCPECHTFLSNNDNVFHHRQKGKSLPIHDTY